MADGIVKQSSYTNSAEGATPQYRLNRRGELVTAELMHQLLFDGRVFVSGDADEDDQVTGQTSFAATTPTFLLRVPSGTTAIPLWVHLNQIGTVAGGIISCLVSFDRVDRYSSSGTSENVTAMRTDRLVSSACTLYSGATAAAATDARLLFAATLDQDVTDPNLTESIHIVADRDFVSPLLVGPAAFLVFTFAATTGPTWNWSLGWAELPTPSAT